MNISEIWIRRPVMTTLVMLGLLFFGLTSYRQLPINNLPVVDFPTISVTAVLPGASPEVMAASVATPLEKYFSSIPGIDSMTSTSTLGSTNINIQFSLERNIDGAAQDVNAMISAAMGVLPREMPVPPTYKKVNPADMPIMFLMLASDTLPLTNVNDFADNIIIPTLSTINGVAVVDTVGTQKFAVRVQVNPKVLANHGIGINEVVTAVQNGNVNLPAGKLDGPFTSYMLESNGQLFNAESYNNLIVTFQKGYPVRIRDLGRAIDGVQNDKQTAWLVEGGKKTPAIIVRINKQPGANTFAVATEVKARLPRLWAAMPAAMNMTVFYDQSQFIQESVNDVQFTMVLTIFLVIAVIFVFIRALKPTIIPSLVVPLSLIATFPVMTLLGFTLNNLSLMAMTLAIGFVVDDAIVVLENIIRRMEGGETPLEASLRGSREIGFTILSMTVSLAVVFVPVLFMGGIVGRLFREFAICIIAAILFSGFLSLTLTPMLASRLLKGLQQKKPGKWFALSERFFEWLVRGYEHGLRWTMRHRPAALVFTIIVCAAMVHLFRIIPKGFIPNQDQNFFRIFTQVEDKTSYASMVEHAEAMDPILMQDPAIAESRYVNVIGFIFENQGLAFISLNPSKERDSSVDEIITRLRPKLNKVPGLIVSLVNPPVITLGSRFTSAQWQFTLQGNDLDELYRAGALMEEKMRTIPSLVDVKSDIQMRKPQIEIQVDRDKAAALGLTLKDVQDAFYSAYATRQVSTMYTPANFYYVILELEEPYRRDPSTLDLLYIRSSRGDLVPLRTVATLKETVAAMSVNHSGQLPAATVSFNLKPGYAIGDAVAEIDKVAREAVPHGISTGFQGTAQAFQRSFANMGFLLLVTVIIIYVVLGILYESFLHPVTILTSLPLAGFGALAALYVFNMELDLYAMIGVIMLVGIVKKNGIMMVDFALEAERTEGLSSEESIVKACVIRFRPIMMTTMAALFGCLPIAVGYGAGAEARQPLGVTVVGGLIFSQFMTLFITPVFYVYLDTLSRWFAARKRQKEERHP